MRHDPPRQTLGDAIKARRLELGWAQIELARRVAASGDPTFRQSDVSRLERGNVMLPHRGRLERIATVLGVPLGELLARSGWAGWLAAEPPSPAAGNPDRAVAGDVLAEIGTFPGRHQFVPSATGRPMARPRLTEALQQAAATRTETARVLEQSEALRALFQRSARRGNDRGSGSQETA
jgi:transcriptional regulator with XRE-family HTH domain